MVRAVRREVVNTHEMLVAAVQDGLLPKKQAVSIGPAWNTGRGNYRVGWEVYSPFFRTTDSPDGGAWYEYGRKHFYEIGYAAGEGRLAGREAARVAAIAWVKQALGYEGPWVRNGMGDFVPEVIASTYVIRRR